jgi:hypothetical protein
MRQTIFTVGDAHVLPPEVERPSMLTAAGDAAADPVAGTGDLAEPLHIDWTSSPGRARW